MKKIYVSVIIPIYNVEKYLDECMESVCNQTLQELEILCINDGSTDASPQILRYWAKRDSRVKIFTQENKGYGHAVNRGLEEAIGEYVGIVEPDDYIDQNMMKALYKIAREKDVDFVKSDFEMFWGDGEERNRKQIKIVEEDVLYKRQLTPSIDIGVFWGWIANWSGIYKRSFLLENRIRHNETPGASYQDQGFCFQVYALAKKAFFVSEVYYRYRQDNPNSSMLSKEKVFCIADEYDFIYRIMSRRKQQFVQLLPVYIKRKYDLYLLNYERVDENYKVVFLQRFSRDFREHEKRRELKLECFDYKEKKALLMIMNSPELYPIMYEVEVKRFNDLLEGKRIWIYGAGKVAEETWRILTRENKNRVEGILVSDLEVNKKEIHGIDVLRFEDQKNLRTGGEIIVVAVSLKKAEAIVKKLKERKISTYILTKEYITANPS